MKSIFQVNTIYQLFIAINMRVHNIPEGDADIIISDHTPVLKNYIQGLHKSGFFKNVFYVKSLEFNHLFWGIQNNDKAGFYYKSKDALANVYSYPKVKYKDYEAIFVANIDAYTKFVYRENPNIRLFLFEDGASICTNDWKTACKKWNYIEGFNDVYDNVEALYLYSPELMCIDLNYEMRKLPKISMHNKELLRVYNDIFNYTNRFKFPKFVFLEEPFQADNIKNNDLQLMRIIAEEVGYNNFFVKTHPRNTVNRSKELGIAQQAETPWPFELMLMNNSDDETVFITVDSGALISTRAVFSDDVKTMFLYKIIDGPTRNIAVQEFKDYMDKFCELYASKNLLVPYSEYEFRTMLKYLMEEKKHEV